MGPGEALVGPGEDVPMTPVSEENEPVATVDRQGESHQGATRPSPDILTTPLNDGDTPPGPDAKKNASPLSPTPDLRMAPVNQGAEAIIAAIQQSVEEECPGSRTRTADAPSPTRDEIPSALAVPPAPIRAISLPSSRSLRLNPWTVR